MADSNDNVGRNESGLFRSRACPDCGGTQFADVLGQDAGSDWFPCAYCLTGGAAATLTIAGGGQRG